MTGDRTTYVWSRGLIMAMALAAGLVVAASAIAETPEKPRANRLIDSANPYLLQHAHNPVDWYPWGEEAMTKARKENKPIFVSVGYSTCFWCHVAERTIYSNPAIAALMNQWFVNIKVDREERPDVDETYMLARQLMTGSGGWPNNLFLTPDLKPFFAGSYFPPQDQGESPGFTTVLKQIHSAWEKEPKQIRDIAERAHAAMMRLRDTSGKPVSVSKLNSDAWLPTARDEILHGQDRQFGGFSGGMGTKFPQPPLLNLLLTDYQLNGTAESLAAVGGTLDAIASGGIHDHLGGGVHRYSTEPSWSVPHFEKMLYDNAQLLSLYAAHHAIMRDPLAREMTADIAGYLIRRMMAPDGGFYTAEDAATDGKEGESYLWTRTQIAEILGGTDADRLLAFYELTPLPEAPTGPGVLRIRRDRTANAADRSKLADELAALAPLREKLLQVRDRRTQPLRDEKIIVALNGLAISGLARAGKSLGEPRWIAVAKQAGEHLWQHAFDEKSGTLRHHLYRGEARGDGFLDDYALLGLGYLTLGEVSGEPVWSARAATLADTVLSRFVRPDGLVVTSAAGTSLIVPAVDMQDSGDMPSATSAAYSLLARLGKTEPRFRQAATKILARIAQKIEAAPSTWPSFTASAALLSGSIEAAPSSTALDSAAHVKVRAQGQPNGDHDEILVTITIDPGYHANANLASLDYLIPTKVGVPGVPDAKIAYPPGQAFKPKFLPEGISVYEGSTSIKIDLPGGSLAAGHASSVNVQVQVCDLQICLPPSTMEAAVE